MSIAENVLCEEVVPIAAYDPKEGTIMAFSDFKKQIVEGVVGFPLKTDSSEKLEFRSLQQQEGVNLDIDMVPQSNKGDLHNSQQVVVLPDAILDKGEVSSDKNVQVGLPDGQILVHSLEGSYLMEATKWSYMNTQGEKVVGLGDGYTTVISGVETHSLQKCSTQDSSKIMNDSDDGLVGLDLKAQFEDADVDETSEFKDDKDQGWSIPVVKKTRKKGKHNLVSTRFSSRAPRDGILIQEKAMARMKIKNLESQSNTSSCNPFIILNNASDEHIRSVVD